METVQQQVYNSIQVWAVHITHTRNNSTQTERHQRHRFRQCNRSRLIWVPWVGRSALNTLARWIHRRTVEIRRRAVAVQYILWMLITETSTETVHTRAMLCSLHKANIHRRQTHTLATIRPIITRTRTSIRLAQTTHYQLLVNTIQMRLEWRRRNTCHKISKYRKTGKGKTRKAWIRLSLTTLTFFGSKTTQFHILLMTFEINVNILCVCSVSCL